MGKSRCVLTVEVRRICGEYTWKLPLSAKLQDQHTCSVVTQKLCAQYMVPSNFLGAKLNFLNFQPLGSNAAQSRKQCLLHRTTVSKVDHRLPWINVCMTAMQQ